MSKDRVAARNRGHTYRSALLKRQARERLRQIDRQIAAIDAALHAELAAAPALQARFDILVSIPGVGEPRSPCWSRCPSSAPSSPKAPRASPASPRSPVTPASAAASAASAAAALLCARRSTCLPWSRSASTPRMKAKYHALLRRRQTAESRARRDRAQARHPR